QHINGIATTLSGLQIKCNQNKNVISSDLVVTSGSLPDQGSCLSNTAPASNEFSNATAPESHIRIAAFSNNIDYRYPLLPGAGLQVPTQITPLLVSPAACPGLTYSRSSSCPLSSDTRVVFSSADFSLTSGQFIRAILDQTIFPIKAVKSSGLADEMTAYYAAQQELAVDEAIGRLLMDTTTVEAGQKIEKLLKFNGTTHSTLDLVYLYIGQGNYSQAQGLVDDLIRALGTKPQFTLLQHLIGLHQSPPAWLNISADTPVKAEITALAADSLAEGFANARAILAMMSGTRNYGMIEGLLSPLAIEKNTLSVPVDGTDDQTRLMAFPNPFGDEITVRFKLPAKTRNAHLQLTELTTGRLIGSYPVYPDQTTLQLNTAALSSGLYFIELTGENIKPVYAKIVKAR
ncbi:MAG: T9SS type A sorting domain-containing protein, partial [Saprospiraceae bacterium]